MKKTILTLAAILIASLSFAQGGGFNYKALITDNGNVLNTQPVTFKFTVLENGTTSVYQENQTTTTDANGIVAVNLGEGTVVSGDFNTIDWGSNPYFLKVEIDTGSGYQDFGTTEFKAVPYAKFANRVEVADNIQGIPVSSNTPTNGQVLKYNGSQFVPADDDTSGGSGTDGVVNSAAFSGTSTKTLTLGRSNGLGNVTANFTDNDTHLTDAQIGTMGYIKNANDADHDATNELQDLTLSNTQLSISNGNNVNFTGWDTDASDDVQSIDDLTDAKNDGSSIFIGNGAGSNDDGTNNHNVGVGKNALHSNTAGYSNTASGVSSLSSNTTGYSNTANGYYALYSNTTGHSNTASGWYSLYSNTIGNYNTASGMYSLYSNTIGDDNTAYGDSSLYSNTTGSSNTASGKSSLDSNTTGDNNTALGCEAGFNNDTGSRNIFLGYKAGYNETGSDKLYIENSDSATPLIGGDFSTDEVTINGSIAIKDGTQGASKVLTSDATGKASWVTPTVGATELNELSDARYLGYSVFVGENAGHNDDATNNYNVGVGVQALFHNTTGNSNVSIGPMSMNSNTTGEHNVALGLKSGFSNQTGNKNIFLGYKAGYNETGSNKLYIENSDSATPLIGGDFSTDEVTINGSIAIKDGTQGASKVLTSDANGKASWVTPTVGATQLDELSDAKNDGTSIFIGNGAGSNDDGTSNHNVGVGISALHSNTTGGGNTATGRNSLSSNTTGYSNTASGLNSLYSNTTGSYNTASGESSLSLNTSGGSNTASGASSLYSNTTGFSNTASGSASLYSNTTGYYNTASGYQSLSSNTTGIKNTALGYEAGYHNDTGSRNIFLGYKAGYNETGSDKLYIENSDSATPLIGGDFSTNEVTINGDLEITQNIKGKIKAEDSGDTDMKAYIYGSVSNSGGTTGNGAHSSGYSISHASTGVYTVTFTGVNKPTAAGQYTVMTNMRYDNIGFITVRNSGLSFTIRTYNSSEVPTDKAFNFVVYKK